MIIDFDLIPQWISDLTERKDLTCDVYIYNLDLYTTRKRKIQNSSQTPLTPWDAGSLVHSETQCSLKLFVNGWPPKWLFCINLSSLNPISDGPLELKTGIHDRCSWHGASQRAALEPHFPGAGPLKPIFIRDVWISHLKQLQISTLRGSILPKNWTVINALL